MVSATTLTGTAGEHYVISELLRRGFIAALAPTGVPNCDIEPYREAWRLLQAEN